MQSRIAICLALPPFFTHGSMRSYPPQKGWSCVCGARASAVGTSSRPVRVQTPRPNSADVKETAKARAGEGEPPPPTSSPESPTDRPSASSFLAASLNATIKDYI